ncbi:MAG: hypothetical protein OHK0035_10860 [Cyanobacteria bacterium J069]
MVGRACFRSARFGGADCRFYSGNAKVNYRDEFYDYPDAFVSCDARDRTDRLSKRYPKLIAEVRSPSTQAFETGEQFEDYRKLEPLEEYVLISQEERRVECRCRVGVGTWESVVYGAGDRLVLNRIGLELAIARLYRGLLAKGFCVGSPQRVFRFAACYTQSFQSCLR